MAKQIDWNILLFLLKFKNQTDCLLPWCLLNGWKISAIRYSTWPMNGFDSQLNWIQIAQRNEQTKEFFEPCELKRLLILSRLLVTCHRQTFNSLCLLFDILCTLCACDTIALYAIFTINWSRCDNHSFGRSEPENQYFVGIFAVAVACIQCALCRQTQQLNNVCVCVEILQFAEKSKKNHTVRQCEWQREEEEVKKKSSNHVKRERGHVVVRPPSLCWICINWFVINL